ncbi:hypothetical protein OG553_31680 [Streptomyces sp. NBC_00158]
MIRTTPPRPVDITSVVPGLAALARPATRLHPRAGEPTARDSSVGGPLLWPADEPWPHCPAPHPDGGLSLEALRVDRALQARTAMHLAGIPVVPEHTPEEKAVLERIDWDAEWPEGPLPLVPLSQLYVRDVPVLRRHARSGTDLLQVLWCPFHHPDDDFHMPRTVLVWRSAAAVTDVLAAPPAPAGVESEEYVPVPCVLAPEQVTEYPDPGELDEELLEQLKDWSRWEAAGSAADPSYALHPDSYYSSNLCAAPGWKAGGYPKWGYTDPVARTCPDCGTGMDPLLTVDTFEWSDDNRSWIPYEDQEAQAPADARHDHMWMPTAIQIGGSHKQQLYVCPASPDHAHLEVMQ